MAVLPHGVYSTIVFLSLATTLIAPPLLKLAFRAPTQMEQDVVQHG